MKTTVFDLRNAYEHLLVDFTELFYDERRTKMSDIFRRMELKYDAVSL